MEIKSNSTFDMVEVAKILDINFGYYKMGRNILFEYLRYFNILQGGTKRNIPYPDYYKKGFFSKIPISKYSYKFYKIVVTRAGLAWLEHEVKAIIIEEEKRYLKEFYPTFKY